MGQPSFLGGKKDNRASKYCISLPLVPCHGYLSIPSLQMQMFPIYTFLYYTSHPPPSRPQFPRQASYGFHYGKSVDEDTTPIDTPMKVKDKMSSFTHLLSDFWYNSLGSTCTCPYLFVGTNVFQSASLSKSNIRFVGSPIVLQWEGRNTSIRCVIEVNEHFMESLFDRISNGSCLNSISCRQDFQFIKTLCRYFYRDLHHHLGLVIHTWDPGPSWSTPQTCEEELKDDQGRPPPWPPP